MSISIKLKNDKPVNLVIQSWTDYNDHSINVLRDCLNCWNKMSENDLKRFNHGFKFRSMLVDESQGNPRYMYFVMTNENELKSFKLSKLITCDTLNPMLYMDTNTMRTLYRKEEEVA